LAAIGTSEAIAALRTPLSSAPMTSARNAAMIGLEAAGEQGVDGLTRALRDQSPALRTNAAEMLGWLKAGRATPELSTALSDTDAAVRVQAAWALGEIGTPEARLALANVLRSETNSEVRQTSQAALARGEASSRPDSVLEPGWATGFLGVLATIPVGKWAFMTLATGAAVLLLLAGSRRTPARVA
jgi:HEAT repeat protein